MYEEYYGFRERPFSLIPDPDFLYLSSQHRVARAYLEYGLTQRVGVVVLSGEIGTGKTTLIRALIKSSGAARRVGVLYQTSTLMGEELLDLVLQEFGLRGQFSGRAAKLGALNLYLRRALAQGEPGVLIVDEAQNLGAGALEEVRLLSNLTAGKEPLLQIILVGQPGLRRLLQRPELRQLAQRVTVHFHLQPLTQEESREYIRHRLAVAGGSPELFTPEALSRIYALTKGVPRRINTLCDLVLVAGFAEGRRVLEAEFVDLVYAAQPPLAGEEAEGEEPEEEAAPVAEQARSNGHLAEQVRQLAARLTRLEGLLLDLTHELVPALVRSRERPSSPSEVRAEEAVREESRTQEPEPPAPPSRRRWLPWRRR